MSVWMGWATVVTLLLGAAAYLGERAARDAGLPGRWVWLGALGASVGLMGWSLIGPATPRVSEAMSGAQGRASLDFAWLATLPVRAVDSSPALAARLDTFLTFAWIAGAAVVVLALAGGLWRLRRHSARWQATRVENEDVLLSEDFGPALVGVWSPRIVLPRWALSLPQSELRLACRHEAEHRNAKDTRLLFGAATVAALLPWNVGVWWMLRRLRAAVEMDCDERVLRGGVSRSAYAALLFDIGVRSSRTRIPGLAFARPKSLLERRMRMIVKGVNSRRIARAIPVAAVAALLIVAACDTQAPTTPLDGRPSAAVLGSADGNADANAVVGKLTLMGAGDEGTRFLIDGREVDQIPADLDPALIERVEVMKGEDGEPSTVSVFLLKGDERTPAVYVDGVRLHTEDAKVSLAQIPPEDIARVDVRKEAQGDEIRVFLKPVEERSGSGTLTRPR